MGSSDRFFVTSPVDGVIIDRRVNIGQTVVASLNAPSLFLIAKDLNKMQVWVAVNEADIGNIRPGQPVTFTLTWTHPDGWHDLETLHLRLRSDDGVLLWARFTGPVISMESTARASAPTMASPSRRAP